MHSPSAAQPKSAPEAPPSFPFVILISVWFLVVISTTLVTFILPESYASSARIRIEPDKSDTSGVTNHGGTSLYAPYFIPTEVEVIQSEVVLGKVVEELNLRVDWGKKYNEGNGPLKTAECLGLLKARMELRPVRGTSLIEIRVFSDRPEDAAKLANAIANAYRDYRLKAHAETTNLSLPANGMVEILDRAVSSPRPVRPNKPLNLCLGMVAGGFVGFVTAALVYELQRRAFQRRSGVGS